MPNSWQIPTLADSFALYKQLEADINRDIDEYYRKREANPEDFDNIVREFAEKFHSDYRQLGKYLRKCGAAREKDRDTKLWLDIVLNDVGGLIDWLTDERNEGKDNKADDMRFKEALENGFYEFVS
jgi:hypothetical protein